ncbi:hypothetical protein AN910_04405 [Mycobacteroides immunogenum]|nr:hypothetical protein AN910_04405 [Mycobacteroides immunogenum]
MGADADEVGQEPTMVSPASLAETGVVDTTEPTAWSDTEDLGEVEPYSHPSRANWLISGVIFAATAALAGLAVGGAYVFLGQDPPDGPSAGSTIATTSAITTTAAAPPLPAAPTPPPPTPVMLPTRGGIVYVGTQSRRTACEVTPGSVTCNVQFVVSTPIRYGTHANVVTISAVGNFVWGIGDTGQQTYRPLNYGTVYRAFGWTITPTPDGTTFMNDATAHGMTVSVEGVMPF